MAAYNIYMATEKEKYNFIDIAKAAGAFISAVSGCGNGYYIQIDATPAAACAINEALKAAGL